MLSCMVLQLSVWGVAVTVCQGFGCVTESSGASECIGEVEEALGLAVLINQIISVGVVYLGTVGFTLGNDLCKWSVSIYEVGGHLSIDGFSNAVIVGIVTVLYGICRCGNSNESIFIIILVRRSIFFYEVTVGIIGKCCTALCYELIIGVVGVACIYTIYCFTQQVSDVTVGKVCCGVI